MVCGPYEWLDIHNDTIWGFGFHVVVHIAPVVFRPVLCCPQVMRYISLLNLFLSVFFLDVISKEFYFIFFLLFIELAVLFQVKLVDIHIYVTVNLCNQGIREFPECF